MMRIDWAPAPKTVSGEERPPVLCPACGSDPDWSPALSMPGPRGTWTLYRCARCGSLSAADRRGEDYARAVDATHPALRFYVEQGAGIDGMLEPTGWVPARRGLRVLEVGGGFGFVSDFLRRRYGAATRGYDPSPLARAGSAALGLDVVHDYFRGLEPGEAPYDVAFASEVVEHVPDPESFVHALAGSLGDAAAGGRVILTTPNATAVSPTLPMGLLLPILSPGVHLTLFTPEGLVRLLTRCGFATVALDATPTSLRAAATRSPSPVTGAPGGRRRTYRAYLRDRARGGDGSLRIGLLYRLMKDQVNRADLIEGLFTLRRLRAAIRAFYGIDLDTAATLFTADPRPDPAVFDWLPFNLCGVLYHRAVVQMNLLRSPSRATRTARAAAWAGAAARAYLQAGGHDDAELEDLTRAALVLLTDRAGPSGDAAAWAQRAGAPYPDGFGLSSGPAAGIARRASWNVAAVRRLLDQAAGRDPHAVASILSIPAAVGLTAEERLHHAGGAIMALAAAGDAGSALKLAPLLPEGSLPGGVHLALAIAQERAGDPAAAYAAYVGAATAPDLARRLIPTAWGGWVRTAAQVDPAALCRLPPGGWSTAPPGDLRAAVSRALTVLAGAGDWTAAGRLAILALPPGGPVALETLEPGAQMAVALTAEAAFGDGDLARRAWSGALAAFDRGADDDPASAALARTCRERLAGLRA